MVGVRWLVPKAIRQAARRAWRQLLLAHGMRRLRALPAGELPGRRLLAELRAGWNNGAYTADVDYLEEIARHAVQATGAILECGSGLSTLVLGTLAGKRSVPVLTLEHLPVWHARVGAALRRYAVSGVELTLAPLRDYGPFVWYDPPRERLPARFSLVVCDGPPGTTPGGRYGLWPVMREHLARDAVILLDDANRPSESDTLERWAREASMRSERHATPAGVYAIVTGDAPRGRETRP